MARGGIEILEENDEADIADFMLEAMGIESSDFYYNERVLTRENFEKNYKILVKMVENRKSIRAPYFVIGYFALLTGAKISEDLCRDILETAKWEHEAGYWSDEGFALERRIYLEDFQEKIRIHKAGQKLHTASFKYSEKTILSSEVVIGINQFQDYCDYEKLDSIKHLNLDGWGLKSIPKKIFTLSNLKSISLEHNQITELPQEISNLKSLKRLYLCYNYITELPESVGELLSLESLNIIHNNIFTLPNSIKYLKNL